MEKGSIPCVHGNTFSTDLNWKRGHFCQTSSYVAVTDWIYRRFISPIIGTNIATQQSHFVSVWQLKYTTNISVQKKIFETQSKSMTCISNIDILFKRWWMLNTLHRKQTEKIKGEKDAPISWDFLKSNHSKTAHQNYVARLFFFIIFL